MKSKFFLPLALCATTALLASGCATQPTHNGKITSLLGGLVTIETGDYLAPDSTAAHLDGTKIISTGSPSGTSVTALWGFTKYTDY